MLKLKYEANHQAQPAAILQPDVQNFRKPGSTSPVPSALSTCGRRLLFTNLTAQSDRAACTANIGRSKPCADLSLAFAGPQEDLPSSAHC